METLTSAIDPVELERLTLTEERDVRGAARLHVVDTLAEAKAMLERRFPDWEVWQAGTHVALARSPRRAAVLLVSTR